MSIEKVMVLTVCGNVLLWVLLFAGCSAAIDNAGGVHNIIVEAGKEVKQISKEISEDD